MQSCTLCCMPTDIMLKRFLVPQKPKLQAARNPCIRPSLVFYFGEPKLKVHALFLKKGQRNQFPLFNLTRYLYSYIQIVQKLQQYMGDEVFHIKVDEEIQRVMKGNFFYKSTPAIPFP